MGSMKEFFTRKSGNEGIKVPLYKPDGSKSDEYLLIRSVDSDAFREAEANAKRAAIMAAQIEDIEERKRIAARSTIDLQVSLVIGWSFKEEFTPENVREFLIESPQIADAIDQLASRRSMFVEKKSLSSSATQSTKPKKPRARKAPARQKVSTSTK